MTIPVHFFLSCFCALVNVRAFAPRHYSVASSIGSRLFDSASDDNDGLGDLFAEQRRKFLENGATPKLPDSGRPPSKSQVYNDDELQNLWDLHKQLSSQTPRVQQSMENVLEEAMIPSIHDLVMETLGDISGSSINGNSNNAAEPSYSWWTEEIQQRSRNIKAIASDVDGTLIGSDQTVHPRTKSAIQKAVQAAFSPMEPLQWFFPATGKTRAGALNSLGPEIAALLQQCPGVFIQGLYCVYGDKVIFEKKLNGDAVSACEELVAKTGTSIIAYDGDNLYTTDLTQTVINLHAIYGEPLSQEIPSIAGHVPGVHKILVCDDDNDKLVNVVRPQMEKLAAANNARVTQAVPTMLELLPEGCSKALGVQKLCEVLGIDPSKDLLAIGDAENDSEMLQMACIGVVVGNGSPPAKEAGDIIMDETSDQGGAGIAIEVLGRLK